MNATAGTGALLTRDQVVLVEYDLLEAGPQAAFVAEGQVFGDAEALRNVYNSGPCILRLSNGQTAPAHLMDATSRGAAEIRVTGPILWS